MVPVLLFDGKGVEVFNYNGMVLFNPKHVAECLGIIDVNSSIRDMSEKQVVKLTNSDMHNMQIRKLNNAGENFLTESGVYKLIFKSRKPSAERFQDWVTDEVLPAIRKTGSYAMNEPHRKISEAITESVETFAAYFKVCQLIGCDNNVSTISANQAVNKRFGVNLLEDLGQTHLIALKQEVFFTPTELGSRNNISARAFNELLGSIGMQCKENKKWIPTEQGLEFCKILDTGKKRGSGAPITQVKWSEKVLPLLPSMN